MTQFEISKSRDMSRMTWRVMGRLDRKNKYGNEFADEVADMDRRKQSEYITDIRKEVQSSCTYWYSLAKSLHECFIAMTRTVKNNAPNGDICVWRVEQLSQHFGLNSLIGNLLDYLILVLLDFGICQFALILISALGVFSSDFII